jgi:hypothetical protein
MKNTLLSFKSKSLYRVVISFIAIIFLVVNTACGSADVASTNDLPSSGKHPSGQSTDLYDPLSPPQGGMNNYKDVDPRIDTSDAEAKAERLIDKASAQQKGGKNPLKEVRKELDKKGAQDRAEDFSDDLGRSAQKKADQVSKSAKKGYSNVKENTKSFTEDVSSGADDLGQKAQRKADDIKQAAKKAADAVVKG